MRPICMKLKRFLKTLIDKLSFYLNETRNHCTKIASYMNRTYFVEIKRNNNMSNCNEILIRKIGIIKF